ncbi:MAG: glucose PTS transporter subunit IIA, partial [Lachnospiraceae bacterium]|nr:glucose PTS transporter subunit IIA [Lachnospiraceae bacterium]
EDNSSLKEISMELNAYENAAGIVAALGGKDNITELTCCATRLRVTVKDDSIVKKDDFKKYGAKGLADYGKNLQIIIGTNVQNVLEDVQNVIAGIEVARTESFDRKSQTVVKFNEKIVAPVSGEIIPMSKVNDPAFSGGSLGGGFAVKPVDGTVCAPVAGTISMLFPTLHAFGITTEQGQDVLVHIGVGTVELKGEGFKALAKEGDKVAAGTPVVDVDLQKVSEKVSAMDVIVCFNDVEMENFELKSSRNVKCKDVVKAVVK